MRLLVDTNVYLDLFLDREEKGKTAARFFSECRWRKNRCYVTSMTLRDIGYTAMRALHDAKIARSIQFKTYQICSKVIGIEADDAINALFDERKDYEDSLQIEAAKRNMLDAIITDDIKDYKDAGIPVFTPSEIVDIWMREEN